MVIEFKRPAGPHTTDVLPAEFVVLMRNENKIIAVFGLENQSDLAGFGDTTAGAIRDLANKMDAEKWPLPGIDFER
jgi:hypothetical protein